MSQTVTKALEPLEKLLAEATPQVRDVVERKVARELGREKARRRSSLPTSHEKAIRLRVLRAERDAGWLSKAPSNPDHPATSERE